MKYRKKPVVIEAFQWGIDEVPDWWTEKSGEFFMDVESGSVLIPTLEGTFEASIGDYIIKGVAGELYPIKDEIFQETYDLVEPERS